MPNRLEAKLNVDFFPEGRKNISTGEIKSTSQPDSKNYVEGVQNIGVVEEVLNVGDVSAIGLIVIQNLSKTNFVQVGLTASYAIKIKPGKFAAFPPAGTIYAIANGAALDVQYYIFPEDV